MPGSGSLSGSYQYFYPQMNKGTADVDSNSQVVSLSAGILGDDYSVLVGPVDISKWNNFTITLINTGGETLESGSVEVSPNGTDWEVIDNAFFAGLAAGAITSSQYTESSYAALRVRGISSGSDGALTGTFDTYVTMNNG